MKTEDHFLNEATKFLTLYYEPNKNFEDATASIGFRLEFFDFSKTQQQRHILQIIKNITKNTYFIHKAPDLAEGRQIKSAKHVETEDVQYQAENLSYNVLLFLYYTWEIQTLKINEIRQKLHNDALKTVDFQNPEELLLVLINRVQHGIKTTNLYDKIKHIGDFDREIPIPLQRLNETVFNVENANDTLTESSELYQEKDFGQGNIRAPRKYDYTSGNTKAKIVSFFLLTVYEPSATPSKTGTIKLIKRKTPIALPKKPLETTDEAKQFLNELYPIHQADASSILLLWSFATNQKKITFKHLFFGKEFIEEVIKEKYKTDSERIITLAFNKTLHELALTLGAIAFKKHKKTAAQHGIYIASLSNAIKRLLDKGKEESPYDTEDHAVLSIHKNTSFIKRLTTESAKALLETTYPGLSEEITNNATLKLKEIISSILPEWIFRDTYDIIGAYDDRSVERAAQLIPTLKDYEKHGFVRVFISDSTDSVTEKTKEKLAQNTKTHTALINFIFSHITTLYLSALLVDENIAAQHIEALKTSGISARTIAGPFFKLFATDPNKGPKEYIKTPQAILSLIPLDQQVAICAIILDEDYKDPVIKEAIIKATEKAITEHPTDPCPSITMVRQSINQQKRLREEEEKKSALKNIPKVLEWLQASTQRNRAFVTNFHVTMPRLDATGFPSHTYRRLEATEQDAAFIINWSTDKRTCLLDTILRCGFSNISTVLTILDNHTGKVERVIALSELDECFIIDFYSAYVKNPVTNELETIPRQELIKVYQSNQKTFKKCAAGHALFESRMLVLETKFYSTDYNNKPDETLFNSLQALRFPRTKDAYAILKLFQSVSKAFKTPVFFWTTNGMRGCPELDRYYLGRP